MECQGNFYLDARYSYSAAIDSSALICLNESERKRFEAGRHDYISELAQQIHMSAPYSDTSHYFARDLYRGPDASEYREAVGKAIVNHTWIAQQRRPSSKLLADRDHSALACKQS